MEQVTSLDGRQRIREAVTLAVNGEYAQATDVIEEISKDENMARGAMVYLCHLLLAIGNSGVVTPTGEDFLKILSHVFKVSAQDEAEEWF